MKKEILKSLLDMSVELNEKYKKMPPDQGYEEKGIFSKFSCDLGTMYHSSGEIIIPVDLMRNTKHFMNSKNPEVAELCKNIWEKLLKNYEHNFMD